MARHFTPAVAAAASQSTPLPAAHRPYRLTKVEYVPAAQLTGQATNFRTVRLVNTTAGSKTLAELAFSAATVAAAIREGRDIPLVFASLPAGNAAHLVNEGDVLEWQSVPTGTGLADPGGVVIITMGEGS